MYTSQEKIVKAKKYVEKGETENPIKLSFKNLTYTVDIERSKPIDPNDESKGMEPYIEKKKIIDNVSGYAMPGQSLFIMGASGAGKTSLLNILSQRIATNSKSVLEG